MAFAMRLEFQVSPGPSGERATVGDLRRWLAAAEEHGVEDQEELLLEYGERQELEGFFVYGVPA